MAPKSKRPQKNAFSFFLDEYVQNERKRGRFVSLRVGAEECSPLWKELPEEKKQKYGKLAESHKQYGKLEKENKFTSRGVSFAQVERQQKELQSKMEKADAEIKLTISNLDSDTLKSHLFYIIHCNYYCKTEEGVYVPGEIAVVEFSLGSGIRRTYHTLINPGAIPLGYAFEAKKNIDEVHGLPFPPFEEGDSDYFGILDKVLQFLEPGRLPDGRYPPLYCIESNVSASENVLWALSESKEEDKNFFRVFYLHKMFFWLKNKCVEDLDDELVGFPVMANAEGEISKDMFCYVPGISCSFHMASDDKYQNCSLSVVQRYVYLICDHCCQHIGVILVPGKHCRMKADISRKPKHKKQLAKTFDKDVGPSNLSQTNASFFQAFGSNFDGESSYNGDASVLDWKDEKVACSFLHQELESKFGGMEVSSVISKTSHDTCSVSSYGTGRTACAGEDLCSDEEDDENFIRVMSLGRGTFRR